MCRLSWAKSKVSIVDCLFCFTSIIQLSTGIYSTDSPMVFSSLYKCLHPNKYNPIIAQSIPEYNQTHGHISNPNSSNGINCSHNPKPKDPSVTECVVKASHTSVITMCFKENVASIEVNRLRGCSGLLALTTLWREGREKTLWLAKVSLWTLAGDGTKYGMHYGSDKGWGQRHKQTHKSAIDRHRRSQRQTGTLLP